jgi:hypothetical protein
VCIVGFKGSFKFNNIIFHTEEIETEFAIKYDEQDKFVKKYELIVDELRKWTNELGMLSEALSRTAVLLQQKGHLRDGKQLAQAIPEITQFVTEVVDYLTSKAA